MKFAVDDAVLVLSRTPFTLLAWLEGMPAPWLLGNEGPETWSPFDIVGHLVHGEKTDWIARARLILEHGEARPFTPFDRFAQFEDSKGKTLSQLLDELAALRGANLATLRGWNLSPADLLRHGRHPELGTVTLAQLLSTWVAHDLEHMAQIARVMARQYRDDVGPWAAYLPLLGR